MRMVQIRGEKWPGVDARHVRSFWERLRGVKAKGGSPAILIDTRSVHTFGLTRPIQVVALDKDMRVLESRRLAPRRVAFFPEARSILELGEQQSTPPQGSLLEVSND